MTWKIVVRGKVQGVYFRASTKEKARNLGLTGRVRNHQDGSVRIEVQGEEDAFRSFLNWVHKGPDRAEVERVEWEEINQQEGFDEFEIRR